MPDITPCWKHSQGYLFLCYIIHVHVHFTCPCTLYMYMYILHVLVHYTCTCTCTSTFYMYMYLMLSRKKERKNERHLRQWKIKMRVAAGGIQTHDTLYSTQMLYQLSYHGSPAGRVRIQHLMRLYKQVIHVHVLIIL